MSRLDSPDVDGLRAKLRALGYLDAGVDRFVLAPARTSRSTAAIATRSSLRIGGMAALLLGPAGAIGLASRLPGLVTGASDAVVLACYLGVLFGLGATAVSLATGLLVAAVARALGSRGTFLRRAQRLARAAGVLAGLACLTYLTLWWRTADSDFGWSSAPLTLLAIAVAVCASLVFARAVTAEAVGVMARAVDEWTPGHEASSWRISAALAGAAFTGSVLLLVTTAPAETRARYTGETAFAIVPTGVQLTVVAIDGFDRELYDEMRAAGEVDHLGRVFDDSTSRMVTEQAGDPARTWTSLATGQEPELHGVRGLETRRLAGLQGSVGTGESALVRAVSAATDLLRLTRPAVVSGTERREKTFWEIAAEKGLRVGVVNWWATWPATGPGTIISERAVVRLDEGGTLDGEIHPRSLHERLRGEWPRMRELAAHRTAKAFSGVRLGDAEWRLLQESARLDALHVALALHQGVDAGDLLAVYLPGLDIVQQALLGNAPSGGSRPSVLSARLTAVRRYYAYLDELLAPLVEDGDARLVALITHPGRISARDSAWLALRGPVTSGRAVAGTLVDVTPTLLYALGFPMSATFSGDPRLELFSPEFVTRYPVRQVTHYGRRTADAAEGAGALDEEVLERLRSLGYVR